VSSSPFLLSPLSSFTEFKDISIPAPIPLPGDGTDIEGVPIPIASHVNEGKEEERRSVPHLKYHKAVPPTANEEEEENNDDEELNEEDDDDDSFDLGDILSEPSWAEHNEAIKNLYEQVQAVLETSPDAMELMDEVSSVEREKQEGGNPSTPNPSGEHHMASATDDFKPNSEFVPPFMPSSIESTQPQHPGESTTQHRMSTFLQEEDETEEGDLPPLVSPEITEKAAEHKVAVTTSQPKGNEGESQAEENDSIVFAPRPELRAVTNSIDEPPNGKYREWNSWVTADEAAFGGGKQKKTGGEGEGEKKVKQPETIEKENEEEEDDGDFEMDIPTRVSSSDNIVDGVAPVYVEDEQRTNHPAPLPVHSLSESSNPNPNPNSNLNGEQEDAITSIVATDTETGVEVKVTIPVADVAPVDSDVTAEPEHEELKSNHPTPVAAVEKKEEKDEKVEATTEATSSLPSSYHEYVSSLTGAKKQAKEHTSSFSTGHTRTDPTQSNTPTPTSTPASTTHVNQEDEAQEEDDNDSEEEEEEEKDDEKVVPTVRHDAGLKERVSSDDWVRGHSMVDDNPPSREGKRVEADAVDDDDDDDDTIYTGPEESPAKVEEKENEEVVLPSAIPSSFGVGIVKKQPPVWDRMSADAWESDVENQKTQEEPPQQNGGEEEEIPHGSTRGDSVFHTPSQRGGADIVARQKPIWERVAENKAMVDAFTRSRDTPSEGEGEEDEEDDANMPHATVAAPSNPHRDISSTTGVPPSIVAQQKPIWDRIPEDTWKRVGDATLRNAQERPPAEHVEEDGKDQYGRDPVFHTPSQRGGEGIVARQKPIWERIPADVITNAMKRAYEEVEEDTKRNDDNPYGALDADSRANPATASPPSNNPNGIGGGLDGIVGKQPPLWERRPDMVHDALEEGKKQRERDEQGGETNYDFSFGTNDSEPSRIWAAFGNIALLLIVVIVVAVVYKVSQQGESSEVDGVPSSRSSHKDVESQIDMLRAKNAQKRYSSKDS